MNPQSQADELQFSFDSRPQAVVEKEGLTSAERGTLLHLLLSRVDLSAQIDDGYLQQLVAQLEAKKFIAAGEADGISLQGILEFFQCPLGKRLLAADPAKRYREMPFMVTLDSHVQDDALPEGEKNILVQGIIVGLCRRRTVNGFWWITKATASAVGRTVDFRAVRRTDAAVSLRSGADFGAVCQRSLFLYGIQRYGHSGIS